MMNTLSSDTCIGISDLSLRFEGQTLLDQLSLSVSSGDRLAILGTSDSGKSALLKILIGLVRPSRGTAGIMGKDCWKESLAVRRQSAYVPRAVLFDPLDTVNDVLNLSAALRSSEGIDWDFVQSQVERFKIDPRKRVGALDAGQRKIIAIINAMMSHPAVLLLDEPLNEVEEDLREDLTALLQQLDNSQTLIMATADSDLAGKLCRRVALLRQGKLLSILEGKSLLSQVVRRVEISFTVRPPLDLLLKTGNIRHLSWEENTLRCLVVGGTGDILKLMQAYEIRDFKSGEADLPELIEALCTGEDQRHD